MRRSLLPVLLGMTVLVAGLVWVAMGAALEICLNPLRSRPKARFSLGWRSSSVRLLPKRQMGAQMGAW